MHIRLENGESHMAMPIAQLDFLEAARAEERRLLAELEATPAYKRLEAIRATLSAYDDDNLGSGVPNQIQPVDPVRQPKSKRAIWLHNVTNYLREKGARATSGELVKALASRGIDLGGDKAAWKLSSILSGANHLDNVRGEGYGLKEWSKPNGPMPRKSSG
jgi:hypothetical protein